MNTYKRAQSIFSHPDFTVGTGISPVRHTVLGMFAGYTAGMEFHHPPKNLNKN